MEIPILLGQRIKEIRLMRNLTQAALAERVGVEPKHISCIESGKNYPSASTFARICIALEVPPKVLFDFEHLQDIPDLKADIIIHMDKMKHEQLKTLYKIVHTFEV